MVFWVVDIVDVDRVCKNEKLFCKLFLVFWFVFFVLFGLGKFFMDFSIFEFLKLILNKLFFILFLLVLFF